MSNLNEGVGKKIVEALKKQSGSETEVVEPETVESSETLNVDMESLNDITNNGILAEEVSKDTSDTLGMTDFFSERIELEPEPQQSFDDYIPREEAKSIDSVDMPSNIMILKKLVSQLPSGVTRHTGAQIIRQTMEALGISMKSVLTEAQEVQNNLKESAKECQMTIQEYKRKISNLEKQTQNFQKQYAALNDLISLFIQTTKG